jgi:hypothetical protein
MVCLRLPKPAAAFAAIAIASAALLALPGAVALADDLECTVEGTQGDDDFRVGAALNPGDIVIEPDDIVCGGKGDDDLFGGFTGTFYGGPGDDRVPDLKGTFEGGPGDDKVSIMREDAIFEGGPGDDGVGEVRSGTFLGGPGADEVGTLFLGATFEGGPDTDTVTIDNGTFIPGPQ